MPMPAIGCTALPHDILFARRMAEARGWPCIQAEVTHFPDGELDLQWPTNALPDTAVMVSSLTGTGNASIHDRIVQLIFAVHQLKAAGVSQCIGVVPYLGYARSDKKTRPTDLLGLKIVLRHLKAAGLDALLTVDVHTPAALNNALAGPTWSVDVVAPMAEAMHEHLSEEASLAVCAPDVGSWKRARAWAEALAASQRDTVELALVHKQRVRPDKVTKDAFMGDVEGRTVIVVDDMISTGGTMAQAVRTCYEQGAHAVWAAVTHGLLLDQAPTRLAEAGLKGLLISNTVPEDRVTGTPLSGVVHTVDVAAHCANEISAVMPSALHRAVSVHEQHG